MAVFRPDRAGPIREGPPGAGTEVVPLCPARVSSPNPRTARKGAKTPRRDGARAGDPYPLGQANPDWGPTLEFNSPFELLIATILAAQAQDEHIQFR